MNPEPLNWTHTLTEGAIILGPVLLGGWLAFRKVMWTLGEYRPHLHQEKDGPLHAKGIQYSRQFNGD